MRGLFDWWGGLNTWLKVGVSLFFLGVSTVRWYAGYFWPWGWAVGTMLLWFSSPSDAQKKGYHDF